MQSLADQDNQNRQYVAAEREELDPLARIGTDGGLEDTLLLHLSRQLERSQAPTLVLRGAQFLAACLDESDYLREEVENLAQAAGLPAAVLEEGLSLLQTLDPAGVGARDLSQCLELQLRRAGEEGTALAVVQRGLERLARRQYRALAQELGVSQQEVLQAEARIRALDPRPGAAFAPREEPVYLSPTWWCSRGKTGWRSICRRAICRGSASAAATVICTGTIRTRRSAGIWTERSVRSSGPSRRWSSAEPPCSAAPRRWSGGSRRFFRVPVACLSPCVWPT